MAKLEELDHESIKSMYLALIEIPGAGDYTGSTFNKRDMLASSYKAELIASLSVCRSDECREEEYRSFSKRHKIGLSHTPDEAEKLIRDKLKEHDPWLIDDIYEKRKSKLFHILIPPNLR